MGERAWPQKRLQEAVLDGILQVQLQQVGEVHQWGCLQLPEGSSASQGQLSSAMSLKTPGALPTRKGVLHGIEFGIEYGIELCPVPSR